MSKRDENGTFNVNWKNELKSPGAYIKRRINGIGHVLRMEDDRAVKKALRGRVMWRRAQELISAPKKSWKCMEDLAKKENRNSWNEMVKLSMNNVQDAGHALRGQGARRQT